MAKQALENGGKLKAETSDSVENAMEQFKKKTFDVVISGYEMQMTWAASGS